MKVLDRVSGDWLYFGRTPEERHKTRVAQLRIALWAAVHTMAEIQDETGGRIVMYTTTYAPGEIWEPRDISKLMSWLRAQGVRYYAWVCELQKRGAPHYHVCAILDREAKWVKPSREAGGWSKGITWVTDNIRYPWYILKYCQKGVSYARVRKFPKGTRIYGISKTVIDRMSGKYADSYRGIHLPSWYRKGATGSGVLARSRRVVGGVRNGAFVAVTPYSKTDFYPTIILSLGEVQSIL